MRPIGSECAVALEVDGHSVALPFTEETLRVQPILEVREPLLGLAVPRFDLTRRSVTAGCVVTRAGRCSFPALLHACLGCREEPVHVPESRGMFSTGFSLAEEIDGFPQFDLVADRGVERLRYPGLRARGFELRGLVSEPLYLRVDVCGGEAAADFDPVPELAEEEHFYFEPGAVVVDGVVMAGVYQFAFAVDTGLQWYAGGRARYGEKSVTFTMHAPLDEAVAEVLGRESHTVELFFELRDTFPEPNRPPTFSFHLEDMFLRKEQKEPDSPGELCSPYLFAGRGAVTAQAVSEEMPS